MGTAEGIGKFEREWNYDASQSMSGFGGRRAFGRSTATGSSRTAGSQCLSIGERQSVAESRALRV